ncbi:MAG: hypothetical protein JSW47_08230 [Phycisphaerales bacterium]|nr:MAG: hypothetical protein JSW47_08230 [Phycisphaerales bacterium]
MSIESEHFDVRPGTELHKKIVQEVMDRRNFSLRKMTDYHDRWDEADESVRAYVPETELTSKQKSGKKYRREFDYISLELPYSFAIIMTAHTYWSSVFLGRNPVYQFTARHGEPQDQVQAVEAIMDYQLLVGRQLPTLYNWIYDLAKYGLGIVGNYWDREEIVCAKFVEQQKTIAGIPLSDKTEKVRVEERLVGYEGNRLYNVRPYDWMPDPRVPIYDFQKGEYCGRDTTGSYLTLQQDGYINIKEAQKAGKRKGGSGAIETETTGTPHMERPVQPDEEQGPGVSYANIHEMHIRIVPSAWGLGNSNSVEMWVFTIANANTVIGCRPLGLYHNKFPYAVVEYGMGASEFVKLSMVDVIKPLTDSLSWLFNVHFFNVRKALNDVRVVDPSRVTMSDVLRPGAGGVISLKPTAYGTDPKTAIHQLDVHDVTRTHLQDSQFVETMIQRVTGVVDNIMGMVNTSGRKTATEVRTSTGFSTNRLKTPAEYASAVGWGPMTEMMLQNTQQLYEDEKMFRIAGNLLFAGQQQAMMQGQQPQNGVKVTPDMISGFYDFVPVDGNLPVDRFAQANLWKEMLVQLGANPQLALEWDIGGMLSHVMKITGERNIDRFRLNLSPMERLQRQAELGNVVPLGGQSGRSGGTPPGNAGGVQ